jgi:RecB family exonuclease
MLKQKRFTSWSFSRFSDYRNCPFKASLKHLQKIAEPSNQYLDHGSEVHDLVAKYLQRKINRFPSTLTLGYMDVLKKLRSPRKGTMIEEMWAFDKDWGLCQWNDWDRCALRVKMDFAHKIKDYVQIFDWKTGRFRPEEAANEYQMQLELYALATFVRFPDVGKVTAKLVYLEAKHIHELNFFRMMLEPLRELWAERVQPMLTDTQFVPRPNNKCRYCFYRNENKENGGGQCEF